MCKKQSNCSVLAGINKSKEDEINRLFDFGYKAAKEFVLAIKEKKAAMPKKTKKTVPKKKKKSGNTEEDK